jgi:hypothetical protein
MRKCLLFNKSLREPVRDIVPLLGDKLYTRKELKRIVYARESMLSGDELFVFTTEEELKEFLQSKKKR